MSVTIFSNYFYIVLFILIRNTDVKLDFFKHERALQNLRKTAIPANPSTCSEIGDAFMKENIMNGLGKSQHSEKNIFFDGVVETNRYSFCIFSSKYICRLIDEHIPNDRRHYLMDATFKVCPVGPFNQLLIIYISYIEKVN